jgi:uncharacterized protein involved in exopolysaccharide biosynthesis/Mrp family chromosome partitioning ATPase
MQAMEKEQTYMYTAMNVLLRRIWYVLVSVLAVLVPVMYYNHTASPTYEASTTLIFEEPRATIATSTSDEYYHSGTILNQIQEIKSRSVANEVVQNLPESVLNKIPLPEPLPEDFDKMSFYAAKIRKNVNAVPEGESDVIKVTARARDQFSAMKIANTIADVVLERNLRQRRQEVSGVLALIEEEVKRYKNSLRQAELELTQFKKRNQVTSLDQENQELLRRVTSIDVRYKEIKSTREKTEESLNTITQKIAGQRADMAPSIADIAAPMVQRLKSDLSDIQLMYMNLQTQGYPEDHEEMIRLKAEMERLRKNISEEATKIIEAENIIDPLSQMKDLFSNKFKFELELEALKAQERSLQRSVQQYDIKLQGLPHKESQLAQLTRARDVNHNIYMMLSQKREEARITEAQKIGNLRIIDEAELPKRPISPRVKLNLFVGLILGLTVGIGLAFFMESVDTTIKTPEEVEKKIGIPVVGSIPRIRSSDMKANASETPSEIESRLGKSSERTLRLITYRMPSAPASEAYRSLRINLIFADLPTSLLTLLITSSGPREGKSTTVANLAITTAQMGIKTLLIDADLRKPMLHRFFNIPREPGLADILTTYFSNAREIDEDSGNGRPKSKNELDNDGKFLHSKSTTETPAPASVAYPVKTSSILDLSATEAIQPTQINNLHLLGSGALPPNPSEILASETMKNLVSLLKKKYEFIVIDAPPAVAVTDAAVLGLVVDGVALVIESGRNDKEIVLKAKSLLERVGINLVGVILNNVMEKNLYGDYDYYYTYYSHQDTEKKPSKKY